MLEVVGDCIKKFDAAQFTSSMDLRLGTHDLTPVVGQPARHAGEFVQLLRIIGWFRVNGLPLRGNALPTLLMANSVTCWIANLTPPGKHPLIALACDAGQCNEVDGLIAPAARPPGSAPRPARGSARRCR